MIPLPPSRLPRRLALALAGLCLCGVEVALRAEPIFQESEVWGRQESGYTSHFVYGIGVTWEDTLLVGCEGRVEGGDAAEKDLLVKRSTDGGKTWGKDQVIEGSSDKLSWGNPSFVTDGIVTYLFYVQTVNSDIGRVFYRVTKDNGLTWSDRTELTHLWDHNAQGWTQHASIGHGIKKLKEPGRGRVLVAFHHRGALNRPPEQRGYGNDVIELGPDGWKIAGGPPVASERGTNEARLAERADGSLVLIARQAGNVSQMRGRSESRDVAHTWSDWVTQEDIRGTVCDSGLLRFSDTQWLYSFPASTARSAQQRQDLTIKSSSDGGVHWSEGRLLHRGQSTYSDLARDSRGNIYCIYGRDGANFMGETAYVARFNVEWATGRRFATLLFDDADTAFSTRGTWTKDTTLVGRFGSSAQSSTGEASGEWKIALNDSGNYEVYLRWPAHPDAASAQLEVVSHGRILTQQKIDQRVDPGTWFYLGTFPLEARSDTRVRISNTGSGVLLADAVMLQQQ